MNESVFNREVKAGRNRCYGYEDELADIYAAQFEKLGRHVASRFVTLAASKPVVAAATPRWSPPDPDELLNLKVFDTTAEAAAAKVHEQALKAAIPTSLTKGGAEAVIRFDVTSAFAQPILAHVAEQGGRNLGWEARDVIQSVLGNAYEQGLTVPETAVQLEEGIVHLSQTTALMVARTDLNAIANGASLASARVLGADGPQSKVWLATEDERTRPTHHAADGQKVPIDAAFQVGEDQLRYPGDPTGSNGETCNCRCSVTYEDFPDSEVEEVGGMKDETTAAAVEAIAETGVKWRSVLAIEGDETPDGRMLDPGSISWRPLPLTLMAMIENSESGHTGSVVCGRIDRIYRDGKNIIGEGIFDTGEYGTEIARLVADQTLRGVSIDLSADEVEFRPRGGGAPIDLDEPVDVDEPLVMVVTKGLLLGATVCPFPAITGAQIEVIASSEFVADASKAPPLMLRFTCEGFAVGPPAEEDAEEPSYGGAAVLLYPDEAEAAALAIADGEPAGDIHVTLAFLPDANAHEMIGVVRDFAAGCTEMAGTVSGTGCFAAGDDGHPAIAIPSVPGLQAMRAELVAALEASGFYPSTKYDYVPHLTLAYSQDGPLMPDHEGRVGQPLTFSAITLSDRQGNRTLFPMGDAMTAAALGLIDAPLLPPAEWFENPDLDGPTPIVITDEGRVFGHVAEWNVCHIGNPQGPNVCTVAPKSKTGYAYFHLGELITAEGDAISVGQITIDTGHAPMGITAKAAVEHYDNTGSVVARVRCGEDRYGIWFAGALEPEVSGKMLRSFRGAKISGDWRKINGRVDMIGAHCVNIPGLPIPRPAARIQASAAEGEQLLALVAAGIVGEGEPDPIVVQARIEALAARAQGRDHLIAVALGPDAELTAAVEISIRVTDDGAAVVSTENLSLDNEVAMQVDFFKAHAYWAQIPLAGARLTPERLREAQQMAALITNDPDSPQSRALRDRLVGAGLLL